MLSRLLLCAWCLNYSLCEMFKKFSYQKPDLVAHACKPALQRQRKLQVWGHLGLYIKFCASQDFITRPCVKTPFTEPGERTQWINCLLYKREDLCWVPRPHIKSLFWWCKLAVPVCRSSNRLQLTGQLPYPTWQVPTQWEALSQKQSRQRRSHDTRGCPLTSTCMHVPAHGDTHTQKWREEAQLSGKTYCNVPVTPTLRKLRQMIEMKG